MRLCGYGNPTVTQSGVNGFAGADVGKILVIRESRVAVPESWLAKCVDHESKMGPIDRGNDGSV
jgi:hypothetical protein